MIQYASCEECEKGAWRVVLWSTRPDMALPDGFWYIHNTATDRFKKIGPVRLKGKNYYDEAHKIAHERNKGK